MLLNSMLTFWCAGFIRCCACSFDECVCVRPNLWLSEMITILKIIKINQSAACKWIFFTFRVVVVMLWGKLWLSWLLLVVIFFFLVVTKYIRWQTLNEIIVVSVVIHGRWKATCCHLKAKWACSCVENYDGKLCTKLMKWIGKVLPKYFARHLL